MPRGRKRVASRRLSPAPAGSLQPLLLAPRWLEPLVFKKLFDSRSAEVRFGLHARTVGPELLELAEEFAELKAQDGLETPNLDELLDCVPRSRPGADQ